MLIDRVNRIASDRGLTILDVDAVVIGLADAGLRTLHHESESDSEIADRLYQVRGKRDDLFVSRAQALPPGVDEKFAAWLGPSRLKNWPTLNPIARGGLRRKFDAGTPAKQGIEAELIVRYDSLEAAQTRMTARKRLALAFERGADKQPATVKSGRFRRLRAGYMVKRSSKRIMRNANWQRSSMISLASGHQTVEASTLVWRAHPPSNDLRLVLRRFATGGGARAMNPYGLRERAEVVGDFAAAISKGTNPIVMSSAGSGGS